MVTRPTIGSDPSTFVLLLTTWSNQQKQDQQNTAAHDDFVEKAKGWVMTNQRQQELGLAIYPPLVIPKKVTYNDDGTISYSDFPDLSLPVLAPLTAPTPNVTGLVPANTKKQLTIDEKLDAILILLESLVK